MSSRSSKTDPGSRLPDRVVVGRIRRPHGVRGGLLVEVLSDVPDRFAVGEELDLVAADSGRQSVRVESYKQHNLGCIVSFDRFSNRDQVESLRGAMLEIAHSRVPAADEGFFYFFELEGCACHDRTRGRLGRVEEVIEDGGGLLLRVVDDRRELLVPFVQAYLQEVDVEAGRIELDLPEGLIETCSSKS